MTITTELSFDSAHRLSFHLGKCRNIHGHTWKVKIAITVQKFKRMVMDFGDIKSLILSKYDHKIILFSGDSFTEKFKNFNKEFSFSTEIVDFEPTAENIALDIAEMVMKELPRSDGNFVEVEVFETEKQSAKVTVW